MPKAQPKSKCSLNIPKLNKHLSEHLDFMELSAKSICWCLFLGLDVTVELDQCRNIVCPLKPTAAMLAEQKPAMVAMLEVNQSIGKLCKIILLFQ